MSALKHWKHISSGNWQQWFICMSQGALCCSWLPCSISLTHLWCIETHTRTGNSYSTYLRQSLMSCRQCITWLTALFNAHSKWDNKIMWANEGSVWNSLWKAKIWWYYSTTTPDDTRGISSKEYEHKGNIYFPLTAAADRSKTLIF